MCGAGCSINIAFRVVGACYASSLATKLFHIHFTRFSRLALNSLRSTDRNDCDPPVLASRAVESQASTLRPSSVFCLSPAASEESFKENHVEFCILPANLTWRAQCKTRNKKILNLVFLLAAFDANQF